MSVTSHTQRGFTLAEGLLASVVLAMAVVAVAGALSAAGGQSGELERRTAMVTLAQELIEKIASLPVDPPANSVAGFLQGNTDWTSYDDINDFAGFTEQISVPVLGGGSPTLLLTRTVAVQRLSAPDGLPMIDGPFARVTVRIESGDGRVFSVHYLTARVNLVQ